MVTAEGGERFAFSAMVPWVALEASFIAHTAAYLCVLGQVGLGWQSIFGTLGGGRVAKRCCLLVVHNVGSVSYRFGSFWARWPVF